MQCECERIRRWQMLSPDSLTVQACPVHGMNIHGGVAQWIEQRSSKPEVGGSNPPVPAKFRWTVMDRETRGKRILEHFQDTDRFEFFNGEELEDDLGGERTHRYYRDKDTQKEYAVVIPYSEGEIWYDGVQVHELEAKMVWEYVLGKSVPDTEIPGLDYSHPHAEQDDG